MLNESLKRRWPQPGFTSEPPRKVRLLSACRNLQNISNNCQPFSDLNSIRLICKDQPQNTNTSHPSSQRIRSCRHHINQHENQTAVRPEKRKLSGSEDCESLTFDRYSYHQPKRSRILPEGYIRHSQQVMESEFSEFNFWKPVLPDIELELSEFLSTDSVGMDISDVESVTSSQPHGENPEFNAFNFWKVPVSELEIDLRI